MTVNNPDLSLPPRVVLIEDDPLVRFGQEILLKDWGYRVVSAASRQAILDALKDAPTDVAAIIADFDLGGVDTGPILALAVAEAASRGIPTMIMSASYGQSSKSAAEQHGFAHCTKPCSSEELRMWLIAVIPNQN